MCYIPLGQFPGSVNLVFSFFNHFTSYGYLSGNHIYRAPHDIIPEVESHVYFFSQPGSNIFVNGTKHSPIFFHRDPSLC